MKFIVGKKIEMTQLFDENGLAIPVTAIEAKPIIVTQVKNTEKDGYNAVQFGYGSKNVKNINKAQKGHAEKLGNFAGFVECRDMDVLNVGDTVNVSSFANGDEIKISAISKGKGFQGVVKRHGFKGGPRSHGQKHSEREAGSIGATGPQRVFKGIRMPGRMGSDRITIKNTKVVAIDTDNNIIFIKGATPGRRGTLVEVRA